MPYILQTTDALPGGTTLVLTGDGFPASVGVDALQVLVGGVPCEVTKSTPTELSCVTSTFEQFALPSGKREASVGAHVLQYELCDISSTQPNGWNTESVGEFNMPFDMPDSLTGVAFDVGGTVLTQTVFKKRTDTIQFDTTTDIEMMQVTALGTDSGAPTSPHSHPQPRCIRHHCCTAGMTL